MLRKLTDDEVNNWVLDMETNCMYDNCLNIGKFDFGNKLFSLQSSFDYDIGHHKDYVDWYLFENREQLNEFTNTYCNYFNLTTKNFKIKDIKYFYWLTVTGKKRIDVSDENICKMKDCLRMIFNNDNYRRYHDVLYNIETGKYPDKPNLHCHCLIKFDSTNKNFDRDFKRCWLNFFKEEGHDFKMIRFSKKCEDIYTDKQNYLNNQDKSILHQNYMDLEILEHLE